jgi:hypothetical protein
MYKKKRAVLIHKTAPTRSQDLGLLKFRSVVVLLLGEFADEETEADQSGQGGDDFEDFFHGLSFRYGLGQR